MTATKTERVYKKDLIRVLTEARAEYVREVNESRAPDEK